MISHVWEERFVNYELKSVSEKEFNSYHHHLEQATILQSYQWGEIKSSWESLPFGFYANKQLIGTVLILKKKLPLQRSFFYIPKGPILSFDKETINGFTKQLKIIAKQHHAVFVRMDPPVLRKVFLYGEEEQASILNEDKVQLLIAAGFEQEPLTLDLHATIQPRFQAVVNCEDYQLSCLSKKGRQGVQTAKKRGVVIEKQGIEKIGIFAELMKKTEQRKGISLRNEDYFRKLLAVYPNAFLMLGKIHPGKRKDEVEHQLSEVKATLDQLDSNQKKKKNKLLETSASLTKELQQLTKDIAAHGEQEQYISGTLTVPYGDTCELLYAGMDETFKHYMPAYLTWFESISQSGKMGYKLCNLGGIDGHLNDGLIQFKKNFQPSIYEYSGEYNLRTSNWLLYKLVKKAYMLKMKA